MQEWGEWGNHNTIVAKAFCPSCHEIARFWIIDPDSGKRNCVCIGIYPKPRHVRELIVNPERIGNPALARTYQSTIKAYNAGIWDACSTSCRKTLEGLVHHLLPDDARKGKLFDQLKKLPEVVNLSDTLMRLADTLRKGGNIGAHFDLEKEPDQQVSELMLNILDYLFEYIYIM